MGRERATAKAERSRTSRRRGIRRLYRLVGVSLVAAAVVKEARTPAEERTWHGDLGGIVPYDLRPPTLDRLRERMWAPQNPQLVVPRAFGVGWTLNIGRVVQLARDARRGRAAGMH
jgi:hypothetical protein